MSRRVLIAAALVLAFDASAFAQGETLIYQAVALAGKRLETIRTFATECAPRSFG